MMRRCLIATVFGLLVMGSAYPALAQDGAGWYAGVTFARLNTRFQPDYTFVLDGEPQKFDNRASGLQVEVTGGRRYRLNDRFFFGYDVAAGGNRFKWSLSIPAEPAELRYTVPYSLIASLVPEVRVGPGVSLFGGIGAGVGRVHQLKTSPAASSYDYDTLRRAWSLGGGLRLRVSPRLDLTAAFRNVQYARAHFDTFNPAGVRIEHVTDAPRARGVSVGALIGF